MKDPRNEWIAAISAAADEAALAAVETRLLGKKGELQELLRAVSQLPKEERPAAGKAANEVKVAVEQVLAARRETLAASAMEKQLSAHGFDPSQPGPQRRMGSLHPITIVQQELVDLFTSMGFSWQDGPEVESEHYNFDALNIPGDHPARESQDTFWLDDKNLLRTHTSPVQVRTMRRFCENFEPPLKVIVL